MDNKAFSDVLLLVRAYLAKPSADNERTLYRLMNVYFSQGEKAGSRANRCLLFRLRHFLFTCDNNRVAKSRFRDFAAREYLIRAFRPHRPAGWMHPCDLPLPFSDFGVKESGKAPRIEAPDTA